MATQSRPRRRRGVHPEFPAGYTVGYLRVSTDEQASSGAGLGAQRAAVEAVAERSGLTVDEWAVDEGVSGSVLPMGRDALGPALARLADRAPGVLLFAKLDRLTRRAKHWSDLQEQAQTEGWSLLAGDGSVDTLTPHGRMIAGVMAQFAEYERELIRARTRDAMAAKKASGVRLGRAVRLPPEVRHGIAEARRQGATLGQIVADLEARKVPTLSGSGRWYRATVREVLQSVALDEFAAQARAAG